MRANCGVLKKHLVSYVELNKLKHEHTENTDIRRRVINMAVEHRTIV